MPMTQSEFDALPEGQKERRGSGSLTPPPGVITEKLLDNHDTRDAPEPSGDPFGQFPQTFP